MSIRRTGPPSTPPPTPNEPTDPAEAATGSAPTGSATPATPAAVLEPTPAPAQDAFKSSGRNPFAASSERAKPSQPPRAPILTETDRALMNRRLSGWEGPLPTPRNGETVKGVASKWACAARASAGTSTGNPVPKPDVTKVPAPPSRPPAAPAAVTSAPAEKAALTDAAKALSSTPAATSVAASTSVPEAKGAALTEAAQLRAEPDIRQMYEILECLNENPIDHERAIECALMYYDIDTTNVLKDHEGNPCIRFNPKLQPAEHERAKGGVAQGETYSDRSIDLAQSAFADGNPAFLAACLVHEVTHANQIQLHGPLPEMPPGQISQKHAAYELMAYQAALREGDRFIPRLQDHERTALEEQRDFYRNQLTPENRALYDRGDYYNVKEK
jgi:hypothetical protein